MPPEFFEGREMKYPSGYGIIFKQVLCNPKINREAKLVYSLLAAYSGADKECWPSIDEIARCLSASRSSVKTWLRKLTKAGWCEIIRTGRSNVYRLRIPDRWLAGDTSDGQPADLLMASPLTPTMNIDNEQGQSPQSPAGLVPSRNTADGQGRKANNHGDPKPLITFDWTTGEFENLGDAEVARWKETFPAVDVDCEIAKAAAWLTADRRRAKSQYRRFLVGWLTRSQDKGGSRPWAASRR